MIIEFHLAGENRKKLAWAIATIIGTTAEYQYMPTCAYQIGAMLFRTRQNRNPRA